MAKALLDTIREVEAAAQIELEAAHTQADQLESEAKIAAAQYAESSARKDAEQTEQRLADAKAKIEQNRESILQQYRSQADALQQTAERQMPQAVECILSALTGNE